MDVRMALNATCSDDHCTAAIADFRARHPGGTGLWLNYGSGPWPAPAPWLNADVVENDEIKPDLIIDPDLPLPFESGSVERVYLGHVLEHIPWDQIPAKLADIRRVLADDGEVLVVGPDVYRTIERYKTGDEPWNIVVAVLEDAVHFQPVEGDWPGARHAFNAHEARIVGALTAAGFSNVRALDLDETNPEFADFPVTSFARWQCAVKATR